MKISGFETIRALQKKTESYDYLDKSSSKESHKTAVGMIGLAALSICAIGACYKNATELDKSYQDNKILRTDNIYLKNTLNALSEENERLEQYENLVNAMHPFYANVMDKATEEEKKAVQKDNAKKEKRWYDAADVLGLNTAEFYRLKGIER